jgi:hypothetical protein
MSADGNQQNPSCFDDYRKELWGGLKGSHEQFDKAVLTMSAGGLAISLMLVKDLFTIEEMVGHWVLVASWFLFCGSIILTVVSFLTSQKSITIQIDNFEKFAAGDSSYWNKPNPYSAVTSWLNRMSGGFFLTAVIATTLFATINFQERANDVKGFRRVSEGNSSAVNAPPATGHGRDSSPTNAVAAGKPDSGTKPSPIPAIRQKVEPHSDETK